MQNTSTGLALKRLDSKTAVAIIQFTVLFGIAVVAPLFGEQLITGTIVNFILFVSVFLLGTRSAILISLFPSLIALGVGILPSILIPIIPFIIVSNVLLIMTFGVLSKTNYWFAIVFASVAKFLFLTIIGFLAISSFKTLLPFINIIGGTQLITSLSGGLITILFINVIWKNKTKK